MRAPSRVACYALCRSAIDNRFDQNGTAKGFGNLLRGKLAASSSKDLFDDGNVGNGFGNLGRAGTRLPLWSHLANSV
jgi:hypothetical protein